MGWFFGLFNLFGSLFKKFLLDKFVFLVALTTFLATTVVLAAGFLIFVKALLPTFQVHVVPLAISQAASFILPWNTDECVAACIGARLAVAILHVKHSVAKMLVSLRKS